MQHPPSGWRQHSVLSELTITAKIAVAGILKMLSNGINCGVDPSALA